MKMINVTILILLWKHSLSNPYSSGEKLEEKCIIISCEIRLFQSKTNLLKFKSSDTIAIKCLFTTLNHYI
ncbi:unnamed protein product [Onchocerca ochengi]|uniref:Secreted protein n=1 Tax=Onchocerca ochengi TaxID=42157 RepID=A0A182EV85_ONCOC|nr:unnamed protein product [Onchocerca ochengi]